MEAIEKGDFETSQFLYIKDALVVNARSLEGKTALHVACIKGDKKIVKWLLKFVKMDTETPDDGGYTAIHHAVEQ